MKKTAVNLIEKILQSKILLYFAVFVLVLKIFTVAIPLNIPKNIFFADITKNALVDMANQTRQANGLQPLADNQKLDEAAQLKAENMVANNYFDHTSPTGITPWYWFSKAGYAYKYAGENLAIGFFDSQEVYNAWLNSPSHKANLLNPNYKEVGTAVLSGFGPNNTIVVVQDFGSEQPAKALTENGSTTNTKAITNNNVPVKNTETKEKANPVSESEKAMPVASISSNNAGEKVLSQSTESFQSPKNNTPSKPYSGFLNFMIYSNGQFVQDIIYGFLMVVIGLLLFAIIFNSNLQPKRGLVFRSILVIALLSVAAVLNKELIISIIPHQVII